jgi:DNA helicase-2/ATP-dependent DNA helicase PcrA
MLNSTQQEAATTLDGPVMVIAGAGTGKTRTLVHRLAELVRSGVDSKGILLLTFTRRAADEMLARAREILGDEDAQFGGGTFHSFAALCLRRFGDVIGLDERFTILDQGDAQSIIGGLRGDLPKKCKIGRFPKSGTIASILSKAVNQREPIPIILQKHYSHHFAALDGIESIARGYASYKAEHKMVDFDDLLVLLISALERSEDARTAVRRRFTHIMVDEYQDTNLLQDRIVQLIAGDRANVMVVGDDAQSIYAFRGARVSNLFEFADRFDNTRKIVLEENYRSTQPILDLSNAVLKQMGSAFRKQLRTSQSGGDRPQLVAAADERVEAQFICREVKRLQKTGVPLSQIAILFRASRNSYQLEVELRRSKVPFVKYGGFKFTESAHIKDALAFLRVLANPGEVLSLNRVLGLCKGVGPNTMVQIHEAFGDTLDPDVLRNWSGRGDKAQLEQLAGLFQELQDRFTTPLARLERVVEFYKPHMAGKYDDWPRRERDLKALLALSKSYDDLSPMLADFALDPPNRADDKGELADSAKDERLILSTIHSAKGLEWQHVYIIRAHAGCIPHTFASNDLDPAALDEERRLLYVAITRAKDKLTMTYPLVDEWGRRQDVSGFIYAVRPDLYTRKTLSGTAKTPDVRYGRKRKMQRKWEW